MHKALAPCVQPKHLLKSRRAVRPLLSRSRLLPVAAQVLVGRDQLPPPDPGFGAMPDCMRHARLLQATAAALLLCLVLRRRPVWPPPPLLLHHLSATQISGCPDDPPRDAGGWRPALRASHHSARQRRGERFPSARPRPRRRSRSALLEKLLPVAEAAQPVAVKHLHSARQARPRICRLHG